tara:strand:- start:3530 stop:4531 length:1002 start_codon:yes stop_codon:yes gene_type:complete
MTGLVTGNSDLITRSELWSQQLKELLRDELDAQRWVDWLTEFPDGTTFTMPSVGDAVTQTIVEDVPVTYTSLDQGEFQFIIDRYIGSAHTISEKNLLDSFYAERVLGSFVEKEHRAIMQVLESDILRAVGPNASQGGQTVSVHNAVNGYDHRYIGTGTSDTMAVDDFAYAKLALKKANVPMTQLVAIVDPNTAYTLETTSNITNISNNPMWEGIIESGLTTGMRYIRNVFGFDVYESNYLDSAGSGSTTTETVTSVGHHSGNLSITNAGVQNIFFSAEPSVLPIVGAIRQMPTVRAEFNKDIPREEVVTTAYWGVKLNRPENLVVVITDTTAL